MDDTNFFSTDRFQIVRDCSIVSIVNNRENIRLSGTGAWRNASGVNAPID